ncbi:MAG TPA: YceI family protein [Bacteroidota bacterium]
MKQTITLLASILGISVLIHSELPSQPLALKVRREDSHVGFSIYKWAVLKEEGRFKDFDGTITFDPNNPSSTRVYFTIKAASIDSRNEGRDRALRSEEFFHVTKYPTLSFTSVNVKAADNTLLMVEGDLTIRGVTKRTIIPVKILGVNHTGRELGTLVGFESTFTINREDFGVAKGWDVISEEATIQLLIGAGTGTLVSR